MNGNERSHVNPEKKTQILSVTSVTTNIYKIKYSAKYFILLHSPDEKMQKFLHRRRCKIRKQNTNQIKMLKDKISKDDHKGEGKRKQFSRSFGEKERKNENGTKQKSAGGSTNLRLLDSWGPEVSMKDL